MNVNYSEELTTVKVVNMLGQHMFTQSVNAKSAQLDFSSLPTGTYILEVNSGSVSKTVKVIKK